MFKIERKIVEFVERNVNILFMLARSEERRCRERV